MDLFVQDYETICDECGELIDDGCDNEAFCGMLCNECFAELLDEGVIDENGDEVLE